MKLPIDTEKVRFLVSTPPTPVIDPESDTHAVSARGVPLYDIELVAMADRSSAEVITLMVAGEPEGLVQHMSVKVFGLRANAWSDKVERTSGISWWADGVEPDTATDRK
jgi:hypothetical protein